MFSIHSCARRRFVSLLRQPARQTQRNGAHAGKICPARRFARCLLFRRGLKITLKIRFISAEFAPGHSASCSIVRTTFLLKFWLAELLMILSERPHPDRRKVFSPPFARIAKQPRGRKEVATLERRFFVSAVSLRVSLTLHWITSHPI